jgi:hypothetical protein
VLKRIRLRRGEGQTLVISALALPVLFSLLALTVDGANLMVHRRQIQNAADAAALAAAQGLSATGGTCGSSCLAVLNGPNGYSAKNGGTSSLHVCSDPSPTNRTDTNCYEAPYVDRNGVIHDGSTAPGHAPPAEIEVRLKNPVTTFFGSAVGLASSIDVKARAVASANGLMTTVTTPGSTSVVVSNGTTNTLVTPGTTNVITSTIPTNTAFVYAGDTSCSAITISHGADNFGSGGLWSNGGITASGAVNTATLIRVAGPPWQPGAPQNCAYPGSEFKDASGNPVSATPTAQRAPGDWPVALPPTPSTCASGNVTINTSWLGTHPPGVYCFTGTIDLRNSFVGYEFVSTSTSNGAIKCTTDGLSFTGLPSDPHYLLYAVSGGISLNPGQGVTVTGDIFAPNGLVVFTGGGNKVETGFIESLKVTINNGPTTFRGTGPDGGFTTTTSTTTTPASTSIVTTPGNTTTSTSPGSTNTVITGTTVGLNE